MSYPDRFRIVLEREPDASWRAELVTLDEHDVPALSMMSGAVSSSSPGEVLERIGQYLDAREASRLDREHGFAGVPLERVDGELRPVTDAELARYGDVARVLEVLEEAGGPVPTADLERLSGFDSVRLHLALDDAEGDDVVELVAGAGWTLKRPRPDLTP